MRPKYCFIQTAYPDAGLPNGAIEEGYFIEQNGEVTLTTVDAVPITDAGGRKRSALIAEGQTARQAARKLLRVGSRVERKAGFGRPLSYPRSGVA